MVLSEERLGQSTIAWVDLLDPDADEIKEACGSIATQTRDHLLERSDDASNLRARFEVDRDYIFGAIPVPVASATAEDPVFYQEIDLLLRHDSVVTIRKTPIGQDPFSIGIIKECCRRSGEETVGCVTSRLLEQVGRQYSDLVEQLQECIDDLEDRVEKRPPMEVRKRYSHIKRELTTARRQLSPLARAIEDIVKDEVDLRDAEELFPEGVQRDLLEVHHELQRCLDSLIILSDLLAGVRDYFQTKMSYDQNAVMQKLTVIASILLVPTLIVGIYGQNFEWIPETRWGGGYAWSWGLIVASTIAQIIYFRHLGWIGKKSHALASDRDESDRTG